MFKQLAYLGLGAGAIATMVAVGCGGGGTTTNNGFDFSMTSTSKGDASANADGSSTKTYITTTPNAIDSATIGDSQGLSTNGTSVKMTGVIVLAPPSGFSAKVTTSGDGCRYEVWVQDPSCTAPPCGIIVETEAMLNPNGAGSFCPYASEMTDPKNFLQTVWEGDELTVTGSVDNFPHSGSAFDGGTSAQLNSHQVELDSATVTTKSKGVPAALAVTDTDPSMFVPYTGTGWTKYEGTLIKLAPASGKFTTTLNTSSSFTTTCTGSTVKTNGSFVTAPGGAEFADTYAGFYINKDAGEATNCWPTNGTQFSSITGIVNTGFGGSILPSSSSDFAN